MSAKLKQFWKTHPNTKKEHSRKLKLYYKTHKIWNEGKSLSKATKKKISLAKKKSFSQHPELRKKIGRISKERWENKSYKKRVSRKVKEFWRNHPNLKKEYSIKFTIYYKTHPEALKDLLRYSKKPITPSLKTISGIKVRSKGELLIANTLTKRKIPFSYEKIPLMFPELIAIPDFYLKSFNIFVEFYGGHPKAYKSKLSKNILYKKYNIPVIIITPSELKDLDYFLIKEAQKLKNANFGWTKFKKK